ncbi:M48 family metallopeptidase [Magnetococcales bacterium HHB-1]
MANLTSFHSLKIVFITLLGYAVLLFAFLLFFLFFALLFFLTLEGVYHPILWIVLIQFKLIIALPLLLLSFLRAIWVRTPPIEGILLKPENYPILFQEIETLRKKVGAKKIHAVYLTMDINASAIQMPRFGLFFFGFHNILVLGVPLMSMLEPRTFQAVIAHELAHFSLTHSRFNQWVYTTRLRWIQIITVFEQTSGMISHILHRFFLWYLPFFHRHTLLSMRQHELKADALAMQATSPEATAAALTTTDIRYQLWEEEFLPQILERHKAQPEPPSDYFTHLSHFFYRRQLTDQEWQKKATEIKNQHEDPEETHPPTHIRLKSLDMPMQKIGCLTSPTAAEWLLEKQYATTIHQFNQRWVEMIKTTWHQQYQEHQEAITQWSRETEITTPPEQRQENDFLLYASLAERFLPADDLLTLYQRYHHHDPENTDVNWEIGRLLHLQNKNEQALPYLLQARKNFRYTTDACHIALHYLNHQPKRKQEQESWLNYLNRYEEKIEKAEQERVNIHRKDTYLAPGSSKKMREILKKTLEEQKGLIKAAWLAQKQVQHFPEWPCYVLLIQINRWKFIWSQERILHNILEKITPPEWTTLILTSQNIYRRKATHTIRNIGEQIM